MKTKKGFTTVELLVSVTLVTVIVFFLIELIFTMKNIFTDSGIKTKLLAKQALISEKINYDFRTKKLIIATKCGDNCAEFLFSDGTQKMLTYNRKTLELTYGNYKENLVKGSSFGNVIISSETIATTNDINEDNGILTIHIPIQSKYFKNQDFGITVIYQYNSNVTSISGVDLKDVINTDKKIMLIGTENDIKIKGTVYNDPGYYLYDNDTSDVIKDDPRVKVTGHVGDEVGSVYHLYYKYYDDNGNILNEISRNVTVVSSTYEFSYTGKAEDLIIPVSGIYKLEAWGASGGGTSTMKGYGGYASGTYSIEKDTLLKIYVGGQGVTKTDGTVSPGGFNGGGASGASTNNKASSGGGASDIRLKNSNLNSRILVAGGGGGGGCRNDTSFTCSGGPGGGATGGNPGTCSASSYTGTGGSESAGGTAGSYTTNCSTTATAGALGVGGVGSTCSTSGNAYAAGGGGGGYYGGGGGARYGGGAGGSGYCDPNVQSCTLYSGNELFTTTDGKSYELGHNGHGFVKITLISVTG